MQLDAVPLREEGQPPREPDAVTISPRLGIYSDGDSLLQRRAVIVLIWGTVDVVRGEQSADLSGLVPRLGLNIAPRVRVSSGRQSAVEIPELYKANFIEQENVSTFTEDREVVDKIGIRI